MDLVLLVISRRKYIIAEVFQGVYSRIVVLQEIRVTGERRRW